MAADAGNYTEIDFLARTGRKALYAGLFMSPILVARIGGFMIADGFLATAAVLAFLSAATLTGLRRYTPMPVSQLTMLLVALIAVATALASTRAVLPITSNAVGLRLLFVIVVLPWFIRYLLPTPALLKRAVNALILGGAVSGSGCVLQAVFGPTLISGSEVTNAGRFPGFAQNVSDQGGIACITFIMGAAALSNRNIKSTRLVGAAGLTGGGFGLILSGSVSGTLAALIGAAVLLSRGLLTPRTVVIGLVLAVVVARYAFAVQAEVGALGPVDRLRQTLGLSADGAYSTSESRLSTFQAAIGGFFKDPIIGSGLDSVSSLADGIYPAHNIVIGAFYSGGFALGIAIIIALIRPLRGAGHDALPALLLAAGATAVAFSMTAPNPFSRYLWLPLALLMVPAVKRQITSGNERGVVVPTTGADRNDAESPPPLVALGQTRAVDERQNFRAVSERDARPDSASSHDATSGDAHC